MKLGPVTKFDKRKTPTSKKFDDEILSGNCNVIFDLWPIWSNPQAEPRRIVYKTYIFIDSDFLSYKFDNRTKKSLIQLSYYCFQ